MCTVGKKKSYKSIGLNIVEKSRIGSDRSGCRSKVETGIHNGKVLGSSAI